MVCTYLVYEAYTAPQKVISKISIQKLKSNLFRGLYRMDHKFTKLRSEIGACIFQEWFFRNSWVGNIGIGIPTLAALDHGKLQI